MPLPMGLSRGPADVMLSLEGGLRDKWLIFQAHLPCFSPVSSVSLLEGLSI